MISRRQFLKGSAAGMITTTGLPALLPSSAYAEGSVALSLAGSVGESLAKGALGSVGGLAFGDIMSAAGFDLSGRAEINAKLDQFCLNWQPYRTA